MPNLATAAMLAALSAGPAAERPAELHHLGQPIGVARLLVPPVAAAAPLVILLPDALGDDGRAELYAEALSARGIASLTLGLGEDADEPQAPERDPSSRPEAVPLVLAWAERAGFDADRVALLGFGAGGRAALTAAEDVPVVALYPGCRGLELPRSAQALVLHGTEAPDAPACDALANHPVATIRALPGAGHGWDAVGSLWPSEGPKLPDPAGGPRIQSRTNLATALEAAEIVVSHLEGLFGARQAFAR
jgi:dienelactone hydrolase